MKRDYHHIISANDGLAARVANDAFVKKWTTLCPGVVRSIEEAGLELLTFYEFPKAMWKSLRTTDTLENLNREFRRRTPASTLTTSRICGRLSRFWIRSSISNPTTQVRRIT